MMAVMEVLCPMDKAYLTTGSALSMWGMGPPGTLPCASDKRHVKQLITIVQNPGVNKAYTMPLKTKGECWYGISFY